MKRRRTRVLKTTTRAIEPLAKDRCVFCDRSVARAQWAEEHIIPRWVQTELRIPDERLAAVHWSHDGTAVSRREQSFGRLVEGRVCAACNNGWMHSLEERVRPVLRRLLKGEAVDLAADKPTPALLARWACKTVYALATASNYPLQVPAKHRRGLADGELPNRIAVVMAIRDAGDGCSWIQGNRWHVAGESDTELETVLHRSYRISLRLGRLMLAVAYWGEPAWHYRLLQGVHRPIWMGAGEFVVSRPRRAVSRLGEDEFWQLFSMVGVVHESVL